MCLWYSYLPSSRQRLSNDDCLEDYQNCSVLYRYCFEANSNIDSLTGESCLLSIKKIKYVKFFITLLFSGKIMLLSITCCNKLSRLNVIELHLLYMVKILSSKFCKFC